MINLVGLLAYSYVAGKTVTEVVSRGITIHICLSHGKPENWFKEKCSAKKSHQLGLCENNNYSL